MFIVTKIEITFLILRLQFKYLVNYTNSKEVEEVVKEFIGIL